MEFKQSLAQRIIIAFALMSALVAGAFAMGIIATVHLVEEKLISAGLGGDLQRLLLMDSVEDWSHRPEPDQLFYFSGGRGDLEPPMKWASWLWPSTPHWAVCARRCPASSCLPVM